MSADISPMHLPALRPALAMCALVLAVSSLPGGDVSAVRPRQVDGPADTTTSSPAARTQIARVTLDPSIRDIAIVGDSLLADLEALGGAPTFVVDEVANTLRARPDTADVRIRNFAVAGLTNHFGPPEFRRLGAHVRQTFTAGSDLPDPVTVAVSSTGLNGLPDADVADVAPAIIAALLDASTYLDSLGVRTVFVPVFGVNSEIFDVLHSINQPTLRHFRANERIDELNQLLVASGLPFLFDEFRLLDADGDGSADRRYFVAREGTRAGAYDDGIHPNEVGATVYAYNLIDALLGAYEAG
ncbi:MAG: hypothetical protein ABJ382_05155 [Ilumatobacter sp.]